MKTLVFTFVVMNIACCQWNNNSSLANENASILVKGGGSSYGGSTYPVLPYGIPFDSLKIMSAKYFFSF